MTTYRCTFHGGIGQTRDVAPLDVTVPDHRSDPADAADYIAERLYRYAAPHLISTNVNAVVNLDRMSGLVFAGFHVAAECTVVALVDVPHPAAPPWHDTRTAAELHPADDPHVLGLPEPGDDEWDRPDECGVTYVTGPDHDPYASTCDLQPIHAGKHEGDDPLGSVGDRVRWNGGGSCAGDPVPCRDVERIRTSGVQR